MHNLSCFSILSCLFGAVLGGNVFTPQVGGQETADLSHYPVAYNLTTSQTNLDPASTNGSFWFSTFARGSDGSDYFIVSHMIAWPPYESVMYRASILNISDPSQRSQFTQQSAGASIYSSDNRLNATFPTYSFASNDGPAELPGIRSYSTVPGTEFDLIFDMSSSPLLNGGDGMFWNSGGLGYQWAMPAGVTRGWLKLNGKRVEVDSERSLTWYDRQWGLSPPFFTWFQVHLPGPSEDKAERLFSIWNWQDNVNGAKSFATWRIGTAAQQIVSPNNFTVSSSRVFKSPRTGKTWPLDWTVSLTDGLRLEVSSVEPDQELYAEGIPLLTYTGFVNITAHYPCGKVVDGFGVVESYL